MFSLLKDTQITQVLNAVVAGTSEQKSSVLDMQGYDGVCFILSLGAVTDASVLTCTINENTASSTSSPTPTASTTATCTFTASTSSSTMMITELLRPAKRYVFLDFTRTTQNAVINCCIAIQYAQRKAPQTQGATVLVSALGGPEA